MRPSRPRTPRPAVAPRQARTLVRLWGFASLVLLGGLALTHLWAAFAVVLVAGVILPARLWDGARPGSVLWALREARNPGESFWRGR